MDGQRSLVQRIMWRRLFAGLILLAVIALLIWFIFFRQDKDKKTTDQTKSTPSTSQTTEKPKNKSTAKSSSSSNGASSNGGSNANSSSGGNGNTAGNSTSDSNQRNRSQLTNTGPGDVVGWAVMTGLLAGLGHHLYVVRRKPATS